jgi:tetratricopeptide (TPR) repeat protein
LEIQQRNMQRYRKKRPYIRILLVFLTLLALFLIMRKIIFLTPYLSDKYKMFTVVDAQLETPVTNLPPAEQKNYYQKIINGLNKSLDRDPLNEFACLLIGKACWYKSRLENNRESRSVLLEKARQNIRKGFALTRIDRYPSFHITLGDIYMSLGPDYYFEALKEYQAAKRLKSFSIDLQKKMSFIYLKKGQYGQAVKLFQALLKWEKSPENYLYTGECDYHLGRPDTAEQNLNYVIDSFKGEAPERFDPHYLAEAFLYLGRIYADKKSFGIAQGHMEKALGIEPENLEIMAGLEQLYKDAGRSAAASEMSKRIKILVKLMESRTNIKSGPR